MRCLPPLHPVLILLTTLHAAIASGQTLGPRPSAFQHITVETTTNAATVAKGGTVSLFADVTPKPKIHVYASGAQEFTPVTLFVTPQSVITPAKPKYPVPEMVATLGVADPVPVYRKPFRITVPIVVSRAAKSGETLTIAGAINYQACDDAVCYPLASMPVTWTVKVR